MGYTDETDGIYPASKNTVIIFDDFTTAHKWADFDFKAKSSAMKMLTSQDENAISLRYAYHWLNNLPKDHNTRDHQRQWIKNFSHKKIPLPSLSKQQEIADFLDQLETLTHSLTAGLPK